MLKFYQFRLKIHDHTMKKSLLALHFLYVLLKNFAETGKKNIAINIPITKVSAVI